MVDGESIRIAMSHTGCIPVNQTSHLTRKVHSLQPRACFQSLLQCLSSVILTFRSRFLT
jgi:hypothetical protein